MHLDSTSAQDWPLLYSRPICEHDDDEVFRQPLSNTRPPRWWPSTPSRHWGQQWPGLRMGWGQKTGGHSNGQQSISPFWKNIHSRMDKINFNFLPTKHSHSWHCESHFWPLWYSCILASSPWSNWHLRGGSESFPDKHWGQQFRASLVSVIIEQLEQEKAWHEVTPFKHWHSEQPSRHWDPSWCSMPSTTQPKSWKLRDLRDLVVPKKTYL